MLVEEKERLARAAAAVANVKLSDLLAGRIEEVDKDYVYVVLSKERWGCMPILPRRNVDDFAEDELRSGISLVKEGVRLLKKHDIYVKG